MISGVRRLVNPKIDKPDKIKDISADSRTTPKTTADFMPVAMPYRNKGRPSLSHGLDKDVNRFYVKDC